MYVWYMYGSLLKSTLDALASKHKNFKVTYILSRPTAAWKGLKGESPSYTASIYEVSHFQIIYVCMFVCVK